MSHLKKCVKKNLINPPSYVHNQLQYECITGSMAYGVSSDNSDMDIYGFCIPNKNIIFPNLNQDYIHLFDAVPKNFEQYQEHHIKSEPHEYDFTIYNIVKYFKLCHDGNPNMVDSLFVPHRCVTFSTQIGNYVRENRNLFLSKKCWHTFKGYAYSQLHLMNTKKKNPEGKRIELIKKYGYDVKFAYHLVRLLLEIEQILVEGDLDLERNKNQLKAIRKGEVSKEWVENFFHDKEKQLEEVYHKSELPYKPRTKEIRNLLFTCLEMHFSTTRGKLKGLGGGDTSINIDIDIDNIRESLIEHLKKWDVNI